MNHSMQYANTETLAPSDEWAGCPEIDLLGRLEDALKNDAPRFHEVLQVTSAKRDGQIIVRLREALPADKRGTLLLDLEAYLKETFDSGLVVWLEALEDKNSLRNLRGIEVKA